MLELSHVSFAASDGDAHKEILNDVSLKVNERFVAITGPNGSGKSTLAKLIAGIIQPTEGKILLDGEDITNLSVTERARRGISYAFQQPVRFKGITVKDLVSLAAGRKITVSEACTYLSEVGLFRARLYRPRSQRVALGRGAQTHRNRHRACARDGALRVRRAGGGDRSLELSESDLRL